MRNVARCNVGSSLGVRRRTARHCLRLILGRGAWLTLLGLLFGLAGARWMAGFIANQLFGVTYTDVATYASVAVLLGVISLIACYLPTRWPMRMNPITALRAESPSTIDPLRSDGRRV